MDECCCTPAGPATLSLARAVSVMRVRVFQIHSLPGQPFFCSRSFFRQCNVVATDNGRCGLPVGNPISEARVAIFAENVVGTFDPCNTFELLAPGQPISFSDGGMGCRLVNNSGADCWDAIYTLSVPTTIDDLIAGCLANLSLIDLDTLPFGTQRRVINDPFNGSPVFSDTLLSIAPLPDTCANPPGTTLAASMVVRYVGIGEIGRCAEGGARRIQMPVYSLTVSASRSRFDATGTWCKRTRTGVLVDPDFSTTCNSQAGPCLDTECLHHNPASGIIEVPVLNTSVHMGLCSSPALPCNQVPTPFA